MSDITFSKDTKILLIGCGKMGESILAGWISSEQQPASVLNASNFTVVEPYDEGRVRLASEYGVTSVAGIPDVASDLQNGAFDAVVLAVKPQVMPAVLDELGAAFEGAAKLPLIITIAAGIETKTYEQALPGCHVVRVMPNMPLQVGMGASVVCAGESSGTEEAELVNGLFKALGTSKVVPESQVDAVCAISGGGPAYAAYLVEAMRDAGVALGLDVQLAEELALETMGGTYAAMKKGNVSPEDMRVSVCSPGGTTLAALAEMDKAGFKAMFENAGKAAVKRAEELRS